MGYFINLMAKIKFIRAICIGDNNSQNIVRLANFKKNLLRCCIIKMKRFIFSKNKCESKWMVLSHHTACNTSWNTRIHTACNPSWNTRIHNACNPSWNTRIHTACNPSWNIRFHTACNPSWNTRFYTDCKPSWNTRIHTACNPDGLCVHSAALVD